MSPIVEMEIQCPHCGEAYPAMIDTTQGDHTTIEDCPVCCRPINVTVHCEPGSVTAIDADAD